MNSEEMRKLLSRLDEDPQFEGYVAKIMEDLVEKYKDKANVQSVTSPSAPNTTKFQSTSYGGLSILRNYEHYDSGLRKNYVLFLKIGSAVPTKIQKTIQEEFLNELSKKYPGDKTYEVNGDVYTVDHISGSAWGGLGIRKIK